MNKTPYEIFLEKELRKQQTQRKRKRPAKRPGLLARFTRRQKRKARPARLPNRGRQIVHFIIIMGLILAMIAVFAR